MSDKTGIEWTDATWNPIVGCSIVSPGCTNCYAMKVSGGRVATTPKYAGLTKPSKAGPVWTGDVRFWESALKDPLKWRSPKMVFVNSMGDLFHEKVPAEWIDRVFAVMALSPKHTFQVLTKRSSEMLAYTSMLDTPERIENAMWSLRAGEFGGAPPLEWPLPNVWLGVSAEDQPRYDERKDHLRNTPAAVHFFSFEPLIGPIVGDYFGEWAIVGGESGPRARPMNPQWVRALREQCDAAGTPFFFKQWGSWFPYVTVEHGVEPPEYLHRWPDDTFAVKTGKVAAGRLLDGREWSQFPTPHLTEARHG